MPAGKQLVVLWRLAAVAAFAGERGGASQQARSKLPVPSIPARLERNILINPLHPDAKGITHTMPEPVWWHERLYAGK